MDTKHQKVHFWQTSAWTKAAGGVPGDCHAGGSKAVQQQPGLQLEVSETGQLAAATLQSCAACMYRHWQRPEQRTL